MTWHGQINRTIWEIEQLLEKNPKSVKLRRELLRTHFLQRYEFDRSLHIPRDDRSFLFLQETLAPACLLLHGAHGTPAEMRDLGNRLYSKGYTVFCPRISRFDIKNRVVTWEAWVTMAETALKTVLQYTDRSFVVGLSLGGTFSLVLSSRYKVRGLVLLAPALFPRLGVRGRLLAMTRVMVPTLFYRFAGWNGEVTRAMDHARIGLKQIDIPILVLQARDDHAVSTRGLKLLRKWAKNSLSEVVLLPHGTHALTRGQAKEEVFERVYHFTQEILNG
jgi:carboxylesterase